MNRLLLITCLAAALPTAAAPSAAKAQDRYALVEQDNRVVRVDRQTGAVDYCRRVGDALTCELAPQERLAWQRETDRLSDAVARLEDRLNRLERDGPLRAPSTELPQDEEAEIDRALSLTERFLRGFFGIVGRLQDDGTVPGR